MSRIEIICPFCGFSKEIGEEIIPRGAKRATCPRCRQRFEIPCFGKNAEHSAETDAPGPDKESPWENRSEIGLLQGVFRTLREVLFRPSSFFRDLSANRGMWEPMGFGLLTGSIGAMFGFFWHFLLLSGTMSRFGVPFFGHAAAGILFVFMITLVPLIIALGMVVYAAFLHLLLSIVRGGGRGFEASFRVIAFSQSAQLLGIIPVIGGWAGLVWQLIVQAAGLKEIHRISYLRLTAAMLIPVALVLLFALAVVLFVPFSVQTGTTYI